MNILISGAFGFVGANLSKALTTGANHRLIAVDVKEATSHFYNELYIWGDLEKIDWDKIDSFIHLAGKAHDTKDATREQEYFDINVGLTKTIFEYFLKSGATKFIFFSSVKAVADRVNGEYLTEDEIPNPQTPYGKSKLEAESYLTTRLHEYTTTRRGERAMKKKVYILRPCMIHGPGNKGNLNLLYKMVKTGIPWPLGAFENERSFLSIGNLQTIVHRIIEEDIEPGIYHLADDEPVSTNRLIELISESLNKKPRIVRINPSLIKALAKLGDVMHMPLNSERLKKLTESYVVSNAKIKKALGLDKLPVSAEEGLKRTLSSFRE